MPIPHTMPQINMHAYGGPEVLFVENAAVPQPKAGEVLIKTAYAGVNRPDVMQRQGLYPMPAGVTPIMGLEVSGEVAALGEGVVGFAIGDPVCALTDGGGYAGYCAVPAGQVLPLPRGFSLAEAAMLPETFFTVWANLFMHGQMKPGESLLVHGGSSGIGLAALAIAQGLGLKTFATVGNDDKKQAVAAFGAIPINYKTENFAEITGGVIYFASEDWEQKNGRNPLMTGITAIFLSGNRGALFFQKLVKNGQNFGAEWSGNGWEWAKKRKKWAGFNRVLNAG